MRANLYTEESRIDAIIKDAKMIREREEKEKGHQSLHRILRIPAQSLCDRHDRPTSLSYAVESISPIILDCNGIPWEYENVNLPPKSRKRKHSSSLTQYRSGRRASFSSQGFPVPRWKCSTSTLGYYVNARRSKSYKHCSHRLPIQTVRRICFFTGGTWFSTSLGDRTNRTSTTKRNQGKRGPAGFYPKAACRPWTLGMSRSLFPIPGCSVPSLP